MIDWGKKAVTFGDRGIIGNEWYLLIKLFQYNWMVRDEWFNICKQLPTEELLKCRIGGLGSILYTFFHIVDVEYSWIRAIQGKSDTQIEFESYGTLQQIKELSDSWRYEIHRFLKTGLNDIEKEIVSVPWTEERYTIGEILNHLIAHEIHHIGQMSISYGQEKLGFNQYQRILLEKVYINNEVLLQQQYL